MKYKKVFIGIGCILLVVSLVIVFFVIQWEIEKKQLIKDIENLDSEREIINSQYEEMPV